MGKPKAPKPPDPAELARAQGEANQQTAITQSLLNMVNQQTPWGSLSYSQRGEVNGVPQFTARTQLSPLQNRLFQSSQRNALQSSNLAGNARERAGHALWAPFRTQMPSGNVNLPNRQGMRRTAPLPQSQSVPGFDQLNAMLGVPGSLDFSGLPDAPEANDAVRQRTEDAMYQRAKAQLDPQFEERARRLENQLVNQGFARGSEAYNNAIERFRQSENDAYQSALQDAIMFGGQEQSRLFGLESQARQQALNEQLANFESEAQRFGMSQAERQQGVNEILQQFGMGQQVFDQDMRRRQQLEQEGNTWFDQQLQQRQQGINEASLARNQPLNELLALMGSNTQVGMPQWAPSPQTGVGQTDVLGANALNQQARQNAFQAQSQQYQGMLGGLTNLAGTALGGWLMSDPEMKEGRAPVEPEQALEGVRNIPVEQWNYKGESQRRVGPMATEWANEFGGDGKTIDTVSAFGMSMSAIQALADKIDKLERQKG